MGQHSVPDDLSPASAVGRLCLLAWMKSSLPQSAATCGHQQLPNARPSMPPTNRAMEVSGDGNLRNVMIGLPA
jgi:hypothetical protein